MKTLKSSQSSQQHQQNFDLQASQKKKPFPERNLHYTSNNSVLPLLNPAVQIQNRQSDLMQKNNSHLNHSMQIGSKQSQFRDNKSRYQQRDGLRGISPHNDFESGISLKPNQILDPMEFNQNAQKLTPAGKAVLKFPQTQTNNNLLVQDQERGDYLINNLNYFQPVSNRQLGLYSLRASSQIKRPEYNHNYGSLINQQNHQQIPLNYLQNGSRSLLDQTSSQPHLQKFSTNMYDTKSRVLGQRFSVNSSIDELHNNGLDLNN
ncbi:UNKNOWN [Stylonychia lemnae]|uniref:Uncharacterized protein n=1 Tax=Stylonychia lemnae TaxID=5949 RepID=A0A078BC49_STYLE|nr:UNKNOWN [Stylonychia lemnae]|eukprot:CDW90822.1 UNKNOWN [Stylonychia lemnae]